MTDNVPTKANAAKLMKARLRADLSLALKARAPAEAALLRALIASIDNAEAPPPREGLASADVHDFHSGSAEVARLDLGDDQLRAIFLTEIAEREASAALIEGGGRSDRAQALRDEIDIMRRYAAHQD